MEKDSVQALRYLRRAANLGYVEAQYRLGLALLAGEGSEALAVEQKRELVKEGRDWLTKAATQNHPKAKHYLMHSMK